MRKPVALAVVALQPAVLCADPEHAGSILKDRLDEIVAQARGIIRIVPVHPKVVTVISVQSILSADPQKAQAVLMGWDFDG
jgi:hypothetical protein